MKTGVGEGPERTSLTIVGPDGVGDGVSIVGLLDTSEVVLAAELGEGTASDWEDDGVGGNLVGESGKPQASTTRAWFHRSRPWVV